MSDRDGNTEIYVMNRDGSGQRRLTFSTATDHSPRWMPDGRSVLFFRTSLDPSNGDNPESYDLFMIDEEGGNLRKLTPDSTYHHFSVREDSPSILDAGPRCSPDGTRIVFQHYQSGRFLISMISADGRLRVPLVVDSGVDFAPWFYPDGEEILFRSHRGGDFDLYRMPVEEGGEPLRVTNDTGHTMFGAFSGDGSRMLYVSNIDEERHEYYHIYAADADGGHRVKLTDGPFADYFPAFRPGI